MLGLIREDRRAEVDALRAEAARLARELGLRDGELARLRALLKAEQAPRVGGAAAGEAVARPGGDPPAGEPAGVTPPAGSRDAAAGKVPVELEPGEREVQTVSDGVARRPVPPQFGGTIVSGTPRRRGAGGIGDPYGDNGPLDGRD